MTRAKLTLLALSSFVSFLLLALPGGRASAQAVEAASRVSELSLFGEFQNLHPDFGTSSNRGILMGGLFTRYMRGPILPSFEIRGGISQMGAAVGMKTVLVGGRLNLRLPHNYKLRPYANLLVGTGEVDFRYPTLRPDKTWYAHDDSIVYNYGAGAEYSISRSLAITGEFQEQHWNTDGSNSHFVLTPYSINVGARYRIPFFARNHR